jgi:hypothetical protein
MSWPARASLAGVARRTEGVDTGEHPCAINVVRRCSTGPEPSGPNSVSDVVTNLDVPHVRRTGRSTDETGSHTHSAMFHP